MGKLKLALRDPILHPQLPFDKKMYLVGLYGDLLTHPRIITGIR